MSFGLIKKITFFFKPDKKSGLEASVAPSRPITIEETKKVDWVGNIDTDLEYRKAVDGEDWENVHKLKQDFKKTLKIEPIEGTKAAVTLEDARKNYTDGYKKLISAKIKESETLTNLKKKFFGGETKELIAPEDLKGLEINYDKFIVEYGKKLYSEKKSELAKLEKSEEKIKNELARFKQNEIFTQILIDEGSRLNLLKTEGLTSKEKIVWKKGLAWYLNLPRWERIALSVALSAPAFSSFSAESAKTENEVISDTGMKAVRGITNSLIGPNATKAYDWLFKETVVDTRKKYANELKNDFDGEEFDIESVSKTKKEYKKIIEEEQKIRKERLITKKSTVMAEEGIIVPARIPEVEIPEVKEKEGVDLNKYVEIQEHSEIKPEPITKVSIPILHNLPTEAESKANILALDLFEVKHVHDSNIKHLFGDDIVAWEHIKDSHDLSAQHMIEMEDDGMTDTYKPLVSYLRQLQKTTGLNPIILTNEESELPETSAEYIKRALHEIAKAGRLNEVKL